MDPYIQGYQDGAFESLRGLPASIARAKCRSVAEVTLLIAATMQRMQEMSTRTLGESVPEETTPVCSHGVPLTDGQVCNGYVGKPVSQETACEHSWQPFPGIPTHRICRKCKKAEDIPQETMCKHRCPSTVHCDVCDPAGRVSQESIPGCLAHPRAPEPYCKNCDKRIDGYRPAETTGGGKKDG